MIAQLTKADFLEKIYDFEGLNAPQNHNSKPVAVLFYKSDDQNFPFQLEILSELAVKFPDIIFYKADVMKEQLLAADLGVRRVPSMLFVPIGGKPTIASGVFSEKTLEKVFKKIFKLDIR